jgi:hypothetical protein
MQTKSRLLRDIGIDLREVFGRSSSEPLVNEESLARFGIGGNGSGENCFARVVPGSARRYSSLKEFHLGFETSGVSPIIQQDNVGVCDVQRTHAREA